MQTDGCSILHAAMRTLAPRLQDPGNLEGDLQAGANTGYTLLWLLVWSTAMVRTASAYSPHEGCYITGKKAVLTRWL